MMVKEEEVLVSDNVVPIQTSAIQVEMSSEFIQQVLEFVSSLDGTGATLAYSTFYLSLIACHYYCTLVGCGF